MDVSVWHKIKSAFLEILDSRQHHNLSFYETLISFCDLCGYANLHLEGIH